MDSLQNADRRSLLMEIQVLHAQMNSKKSNPKREQEIDSKSQGDFCGNRCLFPNAFRAVIIMLEVTKMVTFFGL